MERLKKDLQYVNFWTDCVTAPLPCTTHWAWVAENMAVDWGTRPKFSHEKITRMREKIEIPLLW